MGAEDGENPIPRSAAEDGGILVPEDITAPSDGDGGGGRGGGEEGRDGGGNFDTFCRTSPKTQFAPNPNCLGRFHGGKSPSSMIFKIQPDWSPKGYCLGDEGL